MRLHHRISLLAISMVGLLAASAQAAFKYELATDIADHYIKSFPSEGTTEKKPEDERKQAHEVSPAQLEEKTKREVIFNRIFTQSADYSLVEEKMQPILNKYAWPDLKLFYGTSTTPNYHLMGRINKAHTLLGEGVLATMLVTPTTSIAELKKRQGMIQALLDAPEALAELRESLHIYQEAEESLCSLWTPNDPLYTKEHQEYMESYFYSENSPQGNKSAAWLEFKKRYYRDFWSIQAKFFLKNIISPLSHEMRNYFSPNVAYSLVLPREEQWGNAISFT